MVSVRLVKIRKSYGNTLVLNDLSLEVDDGELAVILGPSGVGKTTTLKIIAGIIQPDSGKIFFDERDVTYLEPRERNVGIVFQSLALFPHMTVWENIAFGLEARKWPEEKIRKRVRELLRMLNLDGLEDRYPRELSGGQQQRVAIARALATNPKVLLMDEPFANLDPLLRDRLRRELKMIQKELSITTIFVTHDQEEAFQIADKLAIMLNGTIKQVGKPDEVYWDPIDEKIARFMGINVINLDELGMELNLPCRNHVRKIIIWPEEIEISNKEGIPAKIKNISKIKGTIKMQVEIPGKQELEIIKQADEPYIEIINKNEIFIKILKCKPIY